jgi:3-oxoacyl-[acyl-carrier-protein] synthase-1
VSIATACASSASAIVQAAELLRAGLCDVVLAGGADLASPLVLQGFGSLEALSDAISNPFSKNRKGINMGEAAAFFLVSREALDDTHIRLLGWGESADAYQQTAPAPDGGGAALAMRRALASAGLEPGAIVYVNLHGTGTGLNDSMEAKAMQQVYGTCIPPCSSTKPIHGHTLGAAGALEAAICWEMLYTCSTKGAIQIPPQRWDGEADPDFPQLPLVKQNAILSQPGACMSNSFAFGGCNASLILGVEND